MAIIKYSRKFSELTKDELKAIITVWKPNYDLTPLKNKDTLVLKATEVVLSELSIDVSNDPKFYFQACDENRAITCMKRAQIETSEYQRDRPKNWHFPNAEEGDFHPSAFEETIHPGNPDVTDALSEKSEPASQNDTNLFLDSIVRDQAKKIDQLMSLLGDKTQSSSIREKFRIEYTESAGLPTFIRQVEEWAKLNNQNDQGKIRKACASLVQSKEGLAVRECINDDATQTWAEFKAQLNAIFGKDSLHYLKELKNMRKKDYEGFGAFLSRLTLTYRYAHDLDDVPLSDHHKKQIKRAYIESLDYPLKGHLESEEHLGHLTYTNLATRSTVLQRAYQPVLAERLNHIKEESINAISQPNKDKVLETFLSEQTKMLQKTSDMIANQSNMMEKLIQLVSQKSIVDSDKRPGFQKKTFNNQRPRMSPEEFEAWRKRVSTQICRDFANGYCHRTNCYRLHQKN